MAAKRRNQPRTVVVTGATAERGLVERVIGALPTDVAARARARGLTAEPVGALDGTGVLRLASGGAEEPVWDLGAEPLTGLGPAPAPAG